MIVICAECGHVPHKIGSNPLAEGCDYCRLAERLRDAKAENERLRAAESVVKRKDHDMGERIADLQAVKEHLRSSQKELDSKIFWYSEHVAAMGEVNKRLKAEANRLWEIVDKLLDYDHHNMQAGSDEAAELQAEIERRTQQATAEGERLRAENERLKAAVARKETSDD
jgi:hypothetical protein